MIQSPSTSNTDPALAEGPGALSDACQCGPHCVCRKKMSIRSFFYALRCLFLPSLTPPQGATEYQKFQAHIVLGLIGSVAIAGVVGLLSEKQKSRELAQQRETQRLNSFNEELKSLVTSAPATISLAYKVSKLEAQLRQRLASTRPEEPADSSKSGKTWNDITNEFKNLRDQLEKQPAVDGLCQRIKIYLRSPRARERADDLRLKYRELYNATTLPAVEDAANTTNAAWDAFMDALSDELQN